jgi:hypothetical protein
MKNKKLTTVLLASILFSLMPIAAMAKESEGKNKVEVKVNTALSNVNLKHNDSDDSKENKTSSTTKEKEDRDEVKNHATSTLAVKITSLNVRKSTTTAVVNWKTKLATLGDVRFSTDKTLVASSTKILETGAFGTSHSITLTGLLPDTTYYYIVSTHDSLGQVKESRVGHFKTKK